MVDVQPIDCIMCKLPRQPAEYTADRHGNRRKCCNMCMVARLGVCGKFIDGIYREYNLTIDDLDDYVYAGGSHDAGKRYFKLKCPNEEPPYLRDRCICGTAILYNYYLRGPDSNGDQHIIILGSQCIKRFVVNSVKNCSDCGAGHNNRLVDRCNNCRVGKCDGCSRRCPDRYARCYNCYEKRPNR